MSKKFMPRVFGVIGDSDGSIQRAIQELQAREGIAEDVVLVGVTAQELGMGANQPLPEHKEPDFLDGVPPWAGRPSIQ